MFRFRRGVLCAAVMLGLRLQATPTLTTISDTLFTADGDRFSGVVTISWPSFEAADASMVAAETLQVKITNGVLFVQLTPTTNALSPAIYSVMYSSQSGIAFNETWTVPPSILPVRISDIRVAPGSVTGSAPGAATSIQISDVIGLQNALNIRPSVGTAFAISRSAVINSTGSIDGAVGNLSDCLHVDGSSGACGSGGSGLSGNFIDGEVPAGTLNGVNNTFTLANLPNPASSVAFYRNGILLRQGADYTISASSLTFLIGAMPQPGDILQASYRMSVSLPGIGFIDAEVPAGTINGVNASFTLSQTPNPAASVAVYRNGMRLKPSTDYTISSSSITFASNFVPQTGDRLLCSYRIAQ